MSTGVESKATRSAGAEPKKTGLFADIKNDVIAAVGEFIATILFLVFAFGAVQVISANLQSGQTAEGTGTVLQGSDAARLVGYYYISAAFGLSLFAVASVFYRFTGSLMNFQVGFSLMLVGAITPLRFVVTAVAQIVGGIVAAALVEGMTPGPLAVAVALGNGTSRTQGLFIEAFATAGLVLSVLFLAAEKHRLTPFAPLGFGFMLFVVELFSVPFTGGAVNTARAFGPACISGFNDYHWIYWLGPTLGSLAATGVYYAAKKLHYWEVNPNQDSTNHRHGPLSDV